MALVLENYASRSLFIDGVFQSRRTSAVQFPAGINAISIGSSYTTGTLSYGYGKHAETRIWNTARTQEEIQANLYTQMTGSETGLVYYYRGNEGAGTTMTNLGSAGAAGNLTLYNSPTWVGRDIP